MTLKIFILKLGLHDALRLKTYNYMCNCALHGTWYSSTHLDPVPFIPWSTDFDNIIHVPTKKGFSVLVIAARLKCCNYCL